MILLLLSYKLQFINWLAGSPCKSLSETSWSRFLSHSHLQTAVLGRLSSVAMRCLSLNDHLLDFWYSFSRAWICSSDFLSFFLPFCPNLYFIVFRVFMQEKTCLHIFVVDYGDFYFWKVSFKKKSGSRKNSWFRWLAAGDYETCSWSACSYVICSF